MDLAVFNFSKKITCFTFYLVLWAEFSTCHSTNLKRRWHTQNFVVNLETMPLKNMKKISFVWWHISAIHIIFGQHNLSGQVKIAISSNQIISRQVKISYHKKRDIAYLDLTRYYLASWQKFDALTNTARISYLNTWILSLKP
jgi:hypothetical protein